MNGATVLNLDTLRLARPPRIVTSAKSHECISPRILSNAMHRPQFRRILVVEELGRSWRAYRGTFGLGRRRGREA